MAHLIQVGAGSGGMPVLDMLCRDPRITRVTLIEPDVYKPHNVERHLFPPSAVGRTQGRAGATLAEGTPAGLGGAICCPAICAIPAASGGDRRSGGQADIGVCAADNEPAKYHWDALMRRHGKPWTLGEVLSGGIGGFVHWFVPGGPCYGCVASHLEALGDGGQSAGARLFPARRAGAGDDHPGQQGVDPDHRLAARPGHARPAGRSRPIIRPGFTSLLLTLQRVPDVFEEAFRPYRFRVPRAADCLICQARPTPSSAEELDVALDQALARLGDA